MAEQYFIKITMANVKQVAFKCCPSMKSLPYIQMSGNFIRKSSSCVQKRQ